MAAAQGRMSCCPFHEVKYDPEKDKTETELEISFQGGRLDALCQLVVDGKLTLEEALPYTGMVEHELQELYESWLWFNSEENQEGSED